MSSDADVDLGLVTLVVEARLLEADEPRTVHSLNHDGRSHCGRDLRDVRLILVQERELNRDGFDLCSDCESELEEGHR